MYIMSNKYVVLPLPKSKTVVTEKPKIKRVVTETEKWTFSKADLLVETQFSAVEPLLTESSTSLSKTSEFVLTQIANKISGYRSQDTEKELLNLDLLVSKADVLELMRGSCLSCYYCKEGTLVLYEYVRDPKQWTLERLDNSRGHNRDNVVLSCLRCNLRRRTMHSDRYLQTKAMSKIVKIAGNPGSPATPPT
jgi:hypothetical protein